MNIEQETQELVRTVTPFSRIILRLTGPGAVASALWVTAGRWLFGAGGNLMAIFAVTLGPALLVILLMACRWMWQDARRYRGERATTPMLGILNITTWVIALIFGLLCPDVVEGRTVSAASQILGDDFVGLSAGFGNTAGILTFVSAFAVFFVAWGENRTSRKRAAGISEEEEEALARQESAYDFLDD